ncbi:uncharacterized protein B0H18DRAFT_1033177 [Fomitopsis serialis]|uniref:uncharacterized protein n=1 Tax=Fomitopsis serialis TaxID=139415 RepID=UPI00200736C5|nr:uncharacterized protein B0H18DRAFT_1033177 [Neoantrodia serialis]KAH9917820.1 hypothetical protein B0H18DRAFT_1033177 [Neoantrodia serialis]
MDVQSIRRWLAEVPNGSLHDRVKASASDQELRGWTDVVWPEAEVASSSFPTSLRSKPSTQQEADLSPASRCSRRWVPPSTTCEVPARPSVARCLGRSAVTSSSEVFRPMQVASSPRAIHRIPPVMLPVSFTKFLTGAVRVAMVILVLLGIHTIRLQQEIIMKLKLLELTAPPIVHMNISLAIPHGILVPPGTTIKFLAYTLSNTTVHLVPEFATSTPPIVAVPLESRTEGRASVARLTGTDAMQDPVVASCVVFLLFLIGAELSRLCNVRIRRFLGIPVPDEETRLGHDRCRDPAKRRKQLEAEVERIRSRVRLLQELSRPVS